MGLKLIDCKSKTLTLTIVCEKEKLIHFASSLYAIIYGLVTWDPKVCFH